jgi:hypothetical protein
VLYDRPVHQLMRDAARALPSPTTTADVVQWFAGKYPLVKETTVTAHIAGLTANDQNRQHFSVHCYEPVFVWTDDKMLAAYDPDLYLAEELPPDVAADDDAEGRKATPAAAADTEFVLATQLEEFLLGHWSAVDWGRRLSLWQGPDGTRGHQLSTPVGRLDLLCVDSSTNALVVVGLQRGRSADQVIGQVARYMGWVRAHLAADSQPVAGIVVAHQCDDRLRYAAAAVPGLTVFTYRLNFELVPAPEVTRS